MQKANLQTVYLLLGSNLGNSREILRQALNLIEAKVGVISLQSNYYETAPWGKLDQPNFLNLAIIVRTKLMPADVLVQTQAIENELGRVREEKWGARLIDIDIIFYDNLQIYEPDLAIPHPLMQTRNFVLVPLAEIAPDFVHPVLNKSLKILCDACIDAGAVKPIK